MEQHTPRSRATVHNNNNKRKASESTPSEDPSSTAPPATKSARWEEHEAEQPKSDDKEQQTESTTSQEHQEGVCRANNRPPLIPADCRASIELISVAARAKSQDAEPVQMHSRAEVLAMLAEQLNRARNRREPPTTSSSYSGDVPDGNPAQF